MFVWLLEVEPITPLVTFSVPPSRTKSQDDLFPQVPRGGRTTVVLNASRRNFSGDIKLLAEGLPEGVNYSFSGQNNTILISGTPTTLGTYTYNLTYHILSEILIPED